ncbi:WD repeat-containing protein 6 [Coemansia nantahalensis]|uniref:WD repeat-containing protein 6 n=2 Tax=Coemansia TaxID=4863 RepID=A0ACC1L8R8_9FUNG|nr:WD repeat-containing protein 6 [Coemansia nantahalensis]KAJ2803299.1 WD repeat-containing protein 6 [Coemansia helicoidea]
MHRFAISVAAEPAAAAGTASRCGTTANARAGARAVCVRRVASTRLTNGWVAQLVRHGGRLYAVSFYNKRLVVTDVARDNAVLLSVACSGGTKPFRVQFGAPGLRVAFLHHGRLWAYALDHTAAECGLSLADAAISPLDMRAVAAATTPAGVTVVATAGEDGCLRIHRGPPSLAVVAASRRHRSAIKCAAFVPPAPADAALYLLTAGAACELRCWEVDVSADGDRHTATVVEYAVAATADDADSDSPDLRIMDLAVVARTGGSVFVAAAYSDSSLVLWRLDMCSRKLDRVAATRTHGCLFSAAVLSHADAAFVLAGTSAGAIVAWDVSPYLADRPPPQPPHESEPAALLPTAHQSGVNSICVHALDGARFLVASGGDDGLVSVSEVAIADGAPARVRTAAATVHASAVQGLGFAGGGPALVSVSTDQRLALWDLRALPDALELALRHMVLTQVADPSALHLSPAPAGHIALVAGMGLEAFEL